MLRLHPPSKRPPVLDGGAAQRLQGAVPGPGRHREGHLRPRRPRPGRPEDDPMDEDLVLSSNLTPFTRNPKLPEISFDISTLKPIANPPKRKKNASFMVRMCRSLCIIFKKLPTQRSRKMLNEKPRPQRGGFLPSGTLLPPHPLSRQDTSTSMITTRPPVQRRAFLLPLGTGCPRAPPPPWSAPVRGGGCKFGTYDYCKRAIETWYGVQANDIPTSGPTADPPPPPGAATFLLRLHPSSHLLHHPSFLHHLPSLVMDAAAVPGAGPQRRVRGPHRPRQGPLRRCAP